MSTATCVRCGQAVPGTRGIHLHEEGSLQLGGAGFHCFRCVTEVMAERRGETPRHVEVDPMTFEDARGRSHTFHFEYLTTGPHPVLRAVELRDGESAGHEVAVVAEVEETSVSLVARLIRKIRAELARTHLREDDPMRLSLEGKVVRGRIGWGGRDEGPCVFVDGRRLDWDTFGRLVETFEGWTFRLSFHDTTEDIP